MPKRARNRKKYYSTEPIPCTGMKTSSMKPVSSASSLSSLELPSSPPVFKPFETPQLPDLPAFPRTKTSTLSYSRSGSSVGSSTDRENARLLAVSDSSDEGNREGAETVSDTDSEEMESNCSDEEFEEEPDWE